MRATPQLISRQSEEINMSSSEIDPSVLYILTFLPYLIDLTAVYICYLVYFPTFPAALILRFF